MKNDEDAENKIAYGTKYPKTHSRSMDIFRDRDSACVAQSNPQIGPLPPAPIINAMHIYVTH